MLLDRAIPTGFLEEAGGSGTVLSSVYQTDKPRVLAPGRMWNLTLPAQGVIPGHVWLAASLSPGLSTGECGGVQPVSQEVLYHEAPLGVVVQFASAFPQLGLR